LMVKAGKAVDEFIQALFPLLEEGDLVIDGGNSFFQDTDRRLKEAESRGILFLGMGISGGEHGALYGPSLMPGGHRKGYELVQDILEKTAAQVADGPCCAYLGPGSCGHFVKMVHNGIEYAFMEAIAEIYDLLRKIFGLQAEAIADVFHRFNTLPSLNSYLVEITEKVLRYKDPETGKHLVDLILDAAEQKGTGKWTAQVALDLGIPLFTITHSVMTRSLSSFKNERMQIAQRIFSPARTRSWSSDLFTLLADALYLTELVAFSEGFHLLGEASRAFDYQLNLPEVARIWKGGCILKASLLERIQKALSLCDAPLLFATSEFQEEVGNKLSALRSVCALGFEHGVPLPALSSALAYLDAWRSVSLPANLIQAQRDYFGAHTYRRIDKGGVFHTEWEVQPR
ncbi:MAG: NADP-dependent phosphogluconate dehydrogenase, partial [Candidatus Caldatribacterium sp.]|nr:NADP-dependent phosphogluconate dehydrogenase [Candidatus Caldatribacterium sp.]